MKTPLFSLFASSQTASATFSRRRVNAFGLTELIVAIGLTAVLGVLLFPSLKAMRERSHTAQCVNNLRNYGIAALNFTASQPDGVVLPYVFWANNPDTGGNSHSSARGASHWYVNIVNHGVGLGVPHHTCPAAEVKYKPRPDGRVGHADNLSNYGWNSSIPYNEGSLLRINNVAHPSRLFLCADSSATKAMEEKNVGSSWNIENVQTLELLKDPDRRRNFGFRHQGRANILFADGHVEARLPSEIPLRTAPRTKEWLEFWQGSSR